MTPRWMVQRKGTTNSNEELQIVTIYAEGEKLELVKKENRKWTYERKLLLVKGEQ
ncbi:hypothetical protein [Oceanobacillus indicireducens]|uniref:Uncharacterized protein n=1 Tax=Oceanobacillus indicireducens TaxID=1004261 RepID=A0A917Y468_9BACI|nr:hypothetical protein [Oceanobacillus indicireducens]GGN64410.1 hypothetical protein GCM10007971_32270 [Oceanobacillus indicireducens]